MSFGGAFSRMIGYFEAVAGAVLTAICLFLIVAPLVSPQGQGDLAMFGFVGGIIMAPIGVALLLAGRALWRDGWGRSRVQLLPVSAGILAVGAFWWVDHGSRLGFAGSAAAIGGLVLCGLLAILGLKR